MINNKKKTLMKIRKAYGRKSNFLDILEYSFKKLREGIVGVDKKIFDKTILYFYEQKGKIINSMDALKIAQNKEAHKQAWFLKKRSSPEDYIKFYKEVEVYPFRQPYNHRLGGFRWYRYLVRHIHQPKILEYGCGSAVLTEYLLSKFPECKYTVADIPSVTLDFVKWKKKKFKYPYKILEIGIGKEGIPLEGLYDLIICTNVLEHTPNPLQIVISFVMHLSPSGVLVIDFVNDPGGENLWEAYYQREKVKSFLKRNLISLKAIDEPKEVWGLYVKDW